MGRKIAVEFIGTALLVFFGVGAATLMFGFGFTGSSGAAGVLTTALTFGLILMALVYAIGSVSGCHVNPAVTMGALLTRRLSVTEAIGYWVAQFLGGIGGALLLWAVFKASPLYSTAHTGLGANGWGSASFIRVSLGGAFLAEVVLTALFVFAVLAITREAAPLAATGLGVGLSLAVTNLVGIPITGASINPARSLGPALIVGGTALSQVWLFIVAPLVGGALAAALYNLVHPSEPEPVAVTAGAPAPEADGELPGLDGEGEGTAAEADGTAA